MPLLAVTFAVLLLAGAVLGWPWGAVAVAGCLLLPLVIVRFLMRFAVVYRDRPLEQKLLRVHSIQLAPEPSPAAPVAGSRKALTKGKSNVPISG